MSLAIDAEKVVQVLLADGWHHVEPKTFSIDSYEILEYPDDPTLRDEHRLVLHAGGQSGICASGFTFVESGWRVSGPLTAVLAVRERAE